MLTEKQFELLKYIQQRIREFGVPPSYDEMKDAVNLHSKSGIHRLINALEERGYIRRLPNRARALEVIKYPFETDQLSFSASNDKAYNNNYTIENNKRSTISDVTVEIPVMGRIAAGSPITALQEKIDNVHVSKNKLGNSEHYALKIRGDSMIESGIFDGDTVIVKRCQTANNGDIIVALIDDEEATLKRFRKKGHSIALEASNPRYETKIYSSDRVKIQGCLVSLIRDYH